MPSCVVKLCNNRSHIHYKNMGITPRRAHSKVNTNFNEKVILVTGASSGIGAAIAIKFAEEGAKVAIVGRNQDKLANVAAKCGKPLVIVADVTKDTDCKRIVEDTLKFYGQIDVLVNNAGTGKIASILAENSMEIFDEVISTNLRSAVLITSLAAPHLVKTKGNIINMSSIAGSRVISSKSFAYCTSKAGLDHFTRSLALDLAPTGVRVNSVNPGPVKTDILQNIGADEALQAALWDVMQKTSILNRVSEPEEVADVVLFLASDKASSITAASYYIDNGAVLNGPWALN